MSPKDNDDQSTLESTIKELSIPKKNALGNTERKNEALTSGSIGVEKVKVEASAEKAKSSNKKKPFTLRDLMSQSKQMPSNSLEVGVSKEASKISNNITHVQKTTLPKWMINYPISSKNIQANIDRELAMDFFFLSKVG